MASEKVSRKMVLETKYVNAVKHTENSKLLLDLNFSPKELEKTVVNSCGMGTGIWAKFRLETGIWYPPPPSRPS